MEVNSLDGTHKHKAELKKGNDWLHCNCDCQIFTIAFVEFDDYSDGVIAQCQECEQILEIQKD